MSGGLLVKDKINSQTLGVLIGLQAAAGERDQLVHVAFRVGFEAHCGRGKFLRARRFHNVFGEY